MIDNDTLAKALEGKQMAEKISQAFSLEMQDIIQLMQKNQDPVLLAALMFKLAQEREQSNKLMDKISEKFDQIMLELKTRNSGQASEIQGDGRKFTMLPEQDQRIISIIEQKGQTSALEVQEALGYSCLNAASQRLNMLFRQNLLKKIQSGKKVVYFLP